MDAWKFSKCMFSVGEYELITSARYEWNCFIITNIYCGNTKHHMEIYFKHTMYMYIYIYIVYPNLFKQYWKKKVYEK